jgi:rubrerythrin
MGPVEALKLALNKEVDAVELYAKLALEAPAANDIFLFLVGEEQKHKQLIERKIVELTK